MDRPAVARVGYAYSLYADRDDLSCRARYISIVVHPDAESMRAAGARHDRKRGAPILADDATIGMFQPARFRSVTGRDGVWRDSTGAHAGTIRLCREHLSPEVIAHECAHAALHITRLHQWHRNPGEEPSVRYTNDVGRAEEGLCYLLGAMIAVVSALVAEL